MNPRIKMQGSIMPGRGAFPGLTHTQTVVADSKVLGYLGRALSLEWTSAQNYLTQASLAKYRGEIDYANAFVDLANQENQHANILIDRLITLGSLPAGSVLHQSVATVNLTQALQSCEELEHVLINLYDEATKYCINTNLRQDTKVFEQLLAEEIQQLDSIQASLARIYGASN